MNITIIAVGKIKERFFEDAIKEYTKRLSAFCRINIIEVSDEKAPANLSAAEMKKVLSKEGDRILKRLPENTFMISLAIDGKAPDSLELAGFLKDRMSNGVSNMTFVIGGSLGLSDDVLKKSDYKLSFSKLTFPHQLMRVILLEQIYRCFKINNNEPYHK